MSTIIASREVADASRKAVFDSFRTFQQVPKDVSAQSADEAHRLQILSCSESFRTQLRTLAANIGCIAESLEGEDENHTLDREYDTVYSIEKSWQICEIFALNPTKLLSLELIKWLKELCYEQPLEVFLAQIHDSDEPESINLHDLGSGGEFGYWDLVYRFVLQGDLQSAVSALRVHSEISDALNSPHDARGGTMAVSGNTITRVQCTSFFDVLATHPFASMAHKSSLHVSDPQQQDGHLSREEVLASTTHTISVEFSSWQTRVRKLRQSNMTLLARIPELDTILRILLGDVSTLEHLCGVEEEEEDNTGEEWSWGKLTIALLLFVYPPPLMKADLCRIVEECMQKTDHNYSNNSLGKAYITTLREVMTGNVAPTLRSFYQLGVGAQINLALTETGVTEHTRQLGLVPLLCTAHLSLLLVSGANKEDLLIPLDNSANEASFFEEVFLESATRLHGLGFPVEVILSYLSVCPMRGKEFARVLLPLVPVHSDKTALSVAQVLRETLGLHAEASALLVARGMWWLRQNTVPPLLSRDTYGSTLAKAAYFFQEAGDAARVSVLLEGSLSRCMWAVVRSPQVFPGLHVLPSSGSLYGDRLRAARLPQVGDMSEIPDNLIELEAALLEAEELLQALDVTCFGESPSQSIVSLSVQSLRGYVTAVRGRFQAASARTLRRSAQRLASLIIDPESGPCVPIRYWLHTLELVGWFANCASSLEDSQQQSPADLEDEQMQLDEASGDVLSSGAVFSKVQVYALLTALQQVSSSHGADLLLAEASIGADADTDATIAQNDKLQVLRLSLLGLLCSSTVHENAERRTIKRQDDGFAGRNKNVGRNYFGREVALNSRSFSKFASSTTRFQPQDNTSVKKALVFDLLSGSSSGMF